MHVARKNKHVARKKEANIKQQNIVTAKQEIKMQQQRRS